jgi:glycosyltransferase involved in cell wall biosynthesis
MDGYFLQGQGCVLTESQKTVTALKGDGSLVEEVRDLKDHPTKVLHVVDRLQTGGVETQLIRILEGYDRSRFLMDVCLIGKNAGDLVDQAKALGASVFFCHKSPYLHGFSRRFHRLLLDKRYSIVHSHFETWSGPILRAACKASVPLRIAHLHGRRAWDFDSAVSLPKKVALSAVAMWGRHWLCQYATDILAVSQAVLDARKLGCDSRQIHYMLWTGGVDTERFSPEDSNTIAEAARPMIIWVGTLRPLKRIDLQLRILKRVLKKLPDAQLLVVGAGEEENALRELSTKLEIEGSVQFLGMRYDIPDLLRSASIFLSCSETEGLPTALLEAQAVGLPVLATDIAPHREALAPELHPYLFEHTGLEKAADSIVHVLRNTDLRHTLGRSARQFVCERHSAAYRLNQLQNFYEKSLRQL